MATKTSATAAPATHRLLDWLTLRNISFVILIFAIGISSYLTYEKYTDANAPCIEGSVFDCGTVLNSAYSEISGIPIALLGLITNLMILGLLLAEPRNAFFAQNAVTLIFGINLFTFGYSMYLIYIQAEVINAYCPWCLTHEALVTALFICSSLRLWKLFRPN
jgi:uncharacterized membrane protein